MSNGITIKLDLDSNQFTIKTNKAGQTLQQFALNTESANRHLKNIDRGVNGLIPKMRDLFITVSVLKNGLVGLTRTIFGWQGAIIKANADIERMTFLMQNLSDATDVSKQAQDAQKNIANLFDTAERAPFSLGALTNVAVKLKSVGIDPLNGSMHSLVDAVAQFGGTDDVLARASIAIQQMAGKGVISMEELRQQLGEAVPTAIRSMARALGLTFQELVDQISQGKVLAGPALQALFDEFQRSMGGAAQRMMGTWNGMVKVLETRWLKFQLAVGDAGFLDATKDALNQLLNAFGPERLQDMALSLGNALTTLVNGFVKAVKTIYEFREAILNTIKAMAALAASFVALKVASVVATHLRNLIAVLAAYRVSMLAAKSETYAFSNAQKAVAASALLTEKKAKFLGSAFIRMASNAGPVGLMIAAITALTTAYELWGNKSEKMIEKVRNGHLLLQKEQQEEAKSRVAQLQGQLRTIQKRIDRAGGETADEKKSIGSSNLTLGELKRNREAISAEINELNIALSTGISAAASDAANVQLREAETRIAESLSSIQAKYRTASNNLEVELQNGSIKQEQFINQLREASRTSLEATDRAYQEEIDKLKNRQRSLTEGTAEFSANAVALEKLIEQQALKRSELERGIVSIGSNEALGGAQDAQSKLERFIARTKVSIDEYAAGLDAGGQKVLGARARFISQLRNGLFGQEGLDLLTDPDQASRLNQILGQIDRLSKLKLKMEGAEETQKNVEQMSSAFQDLQVHLDEARFAFDQAGNGAEVNSFIRAQTVRIEKLVRESNLTKEQAEVFKNLGKELVHNISLEERLADVKSENIEISHDLLQGNERLHAQFEQQRKVYEALIREVQTYVKDTERAAEMIDVLRERLRLLNEQELRETEHPIRKMAREWQNATERMQEASANWLEDATRRLADFVATGKLNFADLAQSIVSDIIRIQIQAQIANAIMGSSSGGGGGGLFGTLVSGLIGAFSGNVAGPTEAPGGNGAVPTNLNDPVYQYANGGIMTSRGPLPLHRYANGGIANKPQLALFGEGRQNEAYVPLPDGRSIPVVQRGGGANVSFNLINESGVPLSSEEGSGQFDGEKFVKDVVLKLANQPGSFRDGLRGALKS